jgi:hypothetical protein
MALTNAEKQARWRERNVVVLTESPEVIAEKLAAMDRDKLRLVVQLLPFARPKPTKSERNADPTPLQLGPKLSNSDFQDMIRGLESDPPEPKGYITTRITEPDAPKPTRIRVPISTETLKISTQGYITKAGEMTVEGRKGQWFVVKADGDPRSYSQRLGSQDVAGPFKSETGAYRWLDKNGATQALAQLPQKTTAQRKTAARRYRSTRKKR